jgi:peptide/nickel transport system substrate-binding protein
VDYDGITKDLLKGQYFVHQSFLPVGLPGALDNNPFKFDPEKAKAILAKAGIKDAHFTLDVENKPPFITIAQSMQASFAQGGVKIDLLPAAGSQVYARVRAKQHQAAIRLWIPDYFDAHSNASAFAWNDGKSSTVAGLNGWQIPQLNKETQAAVAEADPAKRLDLYKKCRKSCSAVRRMYLLTKGKRRSWSAITSKAISRASTPIWSGTITSPSNFPCCRVALRLPGPGSRFL